MNIDEPERLIAEEEEMEETIAPAESTANGALSAEELAAVRELALRAYPETVPELVGGASLGALLGSLEPAAVAYRRIAEGVATHASSPVVPVVPAGSAPSISVDPEQLPSVEKIRRGLATRR